MEVLYTSLLGFFLLLVTYLFFFYNHKQSGNANLPPGKTGLPLIGETLEFLRAGWKGHPEKFISDRVAKYSSTVFKTNLFGSPFVVFAGVNENRFLFSSENKLVRVWFPPHLNKVFFQPPKTVSHLDTINFGKTILNLTRPVQLKSQISAMDNFVHCHFITNWENRDMVRIFPLAKHYTFHFACRFLVGLEDPNFLARIENQFKVLINGAFTVPLGLPGTPFNRALKASSIIRKELLVVIKQRKIDLAKGVATPTQDILSHILSTSTDDDKKNEEDVAYKICGLLFAAHDTVASVCTFVVKYLAELPEVYQQVYEEQLRISKSKGDDEFLDMEDVQTMKYSWNVAREVMRIGTTTQGRFREALTDFTYNGFSIPKGYKIYWHPRSTQTDDELFPEPQKFDPSRFESSEPPPPWAFVPFGGGPRACTGKEFARVAILMFMHHLVKRFRFEKLIPNEKTLHNPLSNPEKGLPVRLIPHQV